MKVLIKVFFSIPFLTILYFVTSINLRLYYSPDLSEAGINKDIYNQLNYLKSRNTAGAAEDMQTLYPEGLMFFECLYGLAWTDFISGMDIRSEVFQNGLTEIIKSIVTTAATIVSHRAALIHNDIQLAIEIRNEIEAFGFPETVNNKKYFLYGHLDIADAFIVWTRAANPSLQSGKPVWWQLNFHLWSILIIFPTTLSLFLIWRNRKHTNSDRL
ncbi:hypothetical protein LVD17_03355 [Fulvivirga ulvae]|uniref:hypothetical protein n=1 Tax=Fulvivirga ulvae TaxID=2904245 RepID=UPI001F3232FE|nr:hypothetical protein [Fulvivirga ulvae]UII32868.1 hypothetical protein LVD17_03355 [Fulvivirga ulvae]